jgi:endonuclease/exonuclease/phosphatase family metal-dependent hydrolase
VGRTRLLRRTSLAALLGGGTFTAILMFGYSTARLNYTDPDGPRYAGGTAATALATAPVTPSRLRVVTMNVEYGLRVDSAIAVLTEDSAVRKADLVLLQEMDEAGAARIASVLGAQYVYYPSHVSPVAGRDFGNAILSRWPIVGDEKLVLPHAGYFRRTRRAAVEATIQVGAERIRVYNVHFAMMTELMPWGRVEQVQTVLADAARSPDPVIIGGDLNSRGLGAVFAEHGFSWPTRNQGPTHLVWSFDHLFLRGLRLAHDGATGVVTDVRGASDHKPVWAEVALPRL